MSSSTSVQVDPDLLRRLAKHPANGAGTTDNETNTLVKNLNSLIDALVALSRLPVVGQAAEQLLKTLSEVIPCLAFSLSCYGTGLRIVGAALANAADSFTATDEQLTKLLTYLDDELQHFENYQSPAGQVPL